MDNKQHTLKKITASSGPSAFEQIFPTGGDPAFVQQRLDLSRTIDHIKADLEDDLFIPSQDILELYLFSIHWLMLYDKVSSRSMKQILIHTYMSVGVSDDSYRSCKLPKPVTVQ